MVEKVLLIDDEQDFLDSLAERMEQRGMKVSAHTSALEVLENYPLEDVDAVILDMVMPDMDGLEALSRLVELHPDLQVILLTGHATIEKGVEAMKHGAMDFLEKPVDLKTLCDKIHQAHKHRLVLVEKRQEEEVKKLLSSKPW